MCFDRRTLSMFFLARSRTAQYVVRYLINCTKRSMGRFPNEKTGKRGNFPHMVGPLPTVFSPNWPVFWSLFSVSPISPVSLVVSPVGQVFKTLNYYWSHPFLAWPHVLKLLTQSTLCPLFPCVTCVPCLPYVPCLPCLPVSRSASSSFWSLLSKAPYMDALDVSATHHIRQTPHTCDVRFTKHHRICITVIITQTIDLPNKTVQSGIFSKFIWDDVLKILTIWIRLKARVKVFWKTTENQLIFKIRLWSPEGEGATWKRVFV